MTTLTGKSIIGSTLSESKGGAFNAVDPSSGQKLEPDFYEASDDEINRAIQLATTAYATYRRKSGKEKADFLDAIGDEINALGDELIRRAMQETGLPEARLTGERARTVNQLKLFGALLREGSWADARVDLADPERKPLPRPDIRSMLRPLGPAGVFGASNFPLAFSVAGGDTASALAAGCTVVVKAHPSHPGTSELVGMAIQRAVQKTGMPEGTFSMLNGHTTRVGLAIVRHPDIRAIGFTGSFHGGKALFDEAVKREVPIPVYAEMGSTNPVFILPGALAERRDAIVRDLAASVTLGTGQFCTNPGLVVLENSDAAKTFKTQFAETISAITPGVMLNTRIQQSYEEGIGRLGNTTTVRVLAKGTAQGNGCLGAAAFLEVDGSDFLKDESLEQEVFGPSTLAVDAMDRSQLLEIAKNLSGHLTATVHGTQEDLMEYRELLEILEQKVGRLLINGYPTGVEVCHAMVHGGPWPATSDSHTTSVGTLAIRRFCRPVCYQAFPDELLPDELKADNPLGILRLVNGEYRR